MIIGGGTENQGAILHSSFVGPVMRAVSSDSEQMHPLSRRIACSLALRSPVPRILVRHSQMFVHSYTVASVLRSVGSSSLSLEQTCQQRQRFGQVFERRAAEAKPDPARPIVWVHHHGIRRGQFYTDRRRGG